MRQKPVRLNLKPVRPGTQAAETVALLQRRLLEKLLPHWEEEWRATRNPAVPLRVLHLCAESRLAPPDWVSDYLYHSAARWQDESRIRERTGPRRRRRPKDKSRSGDAEAKPPTSRERDATLGRAFGFDGTDHDSWLGTRTDRAASMGAMFRNLREKGVKRTVALAEVGEQFGYDRRQAEREVAFGQRVAPWARWFGGGAIALLVNNPAESD